MEKKFVHTTSVRPHREKIPHIIGQFSNNIHSRPDAFGNEDVVHVYVKFGPFFAQSSAFGNFVRYRVMSGGKKQSGND